MMLINYEDIWQKSSLPSQKYDITIIFWKKIIEYFSHPSSNFHINSTIIKLHYTKLKANALYWEWSLRFSCIFNSNTLFFKYTYGKHNKNITRKVISMKLDVCPWMKILVSLEMSTGKLSAYIVWHLKNIPSQASRKSCSNQKVKQFLSSQNLKIVDTEVSKSGLCTVEGNELLQVKLVN